jgi:hypothetical protein
MIEPTAGNILSDVWKIRTVYCIQTLEIPSTKVGLQSHYAHVMYTVGLHVHVCMYSVVVRPSI